MAVFCESTSRVNSCFKRSDIMQSRSFFNNVEDRKNRPEKCKRVLWATGLLQARQERSGISLIAKRLDPEPRS